MRQSVLLFLVFPPSGLFRPLISAVIFSLMVSCSDRGPKKTISDEASDNKDSQPNRLAQAEEAAVVDNGDTPPEVNLKAANPSNNKYDINAILANMLAKKVSHYKYESSDGGEYYIATLHGGHLALLNYDAGKLIIEAKMLEQHSDEFSQIYIAYIKEGLSIAFTFFDPPEGSSIVNCSAFIGSSSSFYDDGAFKPTSGGSRLRKNSFPVLYPASTQIPYSKISRDPIIITVSAMADVVSVKGLLDGFSPISKRDSAKIFNDLSSGSVGADERIVHKFVSEEFASKIAKSKTKETFLIFSSKSEGVSIDELNKKVGSSTLRQADFMITEVPARLQIWVENEISRPEDRMNKIKSRGSVYVALRGFSRQCVVRASEPFKRGDAPLYNSVQPWSAWSQPKTALLVEKFEILDDGSISFGDKGSDSAFKHHHISDDLYPRLLAASNYKNEKVIDEPADKLFDSLNKVLGRQ